MPERILLLLMQLLIFFQARSNISAFFEAKVVAKLGGGNNASAPGSDIYDNLTPGNRCNYAFNDLYFWDKTSVN